MRAVLIVLGTHGDVLPFLALGRRLGDRGHAVTVLAPEPFRGLAERAGLAFEGLGTAEEYGAVLAQADLWRPVRGLRRLFAVGEAALRPVYEAVLRHQGEDCVFVASTLAMGARVAQDRWGVPVATMHLAPSLLRTRHDVPRLPGLNLPGWLPVGIKRAILVGAERHVVDPLGLPPVNALRAELGLPPVRHVMSWWNSPERVILAVPPWYAPPQPDWPRQVLQTPFPRADRLGDADALPPELEAFLRAGAPGEPAPIAFTFGSGMRHGRDFFAASLAICRRLGRRGVLVSPDARQVPENLPGTVFHARYAPFGDLLPHCAAFVHHGGIGTVGLGLAAGIPQLIVPLAFNQFDEARRVRRLGVGSSLRRSRYSPARGARVLRRLLSSPAVRQACDRTRLLCRDDDGLSEACRAVEALAESRRSRAA